MQKPLRSLALLFGALLVAAAAQGASETEPGMWSELLTIDCLGRTHILANTPFAVSFDEGSSEFQKFWTNKVLQRAQARCPLASIDELKASLVPSLEMLMNMLWSEATHLPCDDWTEAFSPPLNPNLINVDVDFPASCSPQTLAQGKGCLLKFDLSGLPDSSLHIAADSCPGSHNMFLSVTLGGALATFMQPCGSTAGCRGGLSCSALPGAEQMTRSDMERAIQAALEMADMFDSDVDDQRCLGAQGRVDFIGEFKSFLTSNFFNGWGSVSSDKMDFCGADLFVSAVNAAMTQPPNRRAETALTYITKDVMDRLGSLRDGVLEALSHASSHRRAMATAARLGQSAARALSSTKDRVLGFLSSAFADSQDASRRNGAGAGRSLLQSSSPYDPPYPGPPQPPPPSSEPSSSGPSQHWPYSDPPPPPSSGPSSSGPSEQWGPDGSYYHYGGSDSGFADYEAYVSVGTALAGEAITVAVDAIPGLVPWDGVLPSGAAALGPDRKSGGVFPARLDRPLFAGAGKPVFGFNGEAASMYVQVSDRVGMSVALPHVNKALDLGARLLKGVQDCRGDGQPLSAEQFRTRFVPWSPEYMMAAMTKVEGSGAVEWGKHMRDPLWGDVRPPLSPAGKLRTPASCQYSSWVGGDGRCALEFTGLAALFGVEELALGWVMETQAFAGSSLSALGQLPSMELQCRGRLCSMVSELTLCSSDADCGADMVCTDMVYSRDGESLAADLVAEYLWMGSCSDHWSMHKTQCSVPSFRQEFRQFLGLMRNDGGAEQGECLSDLSTRVSVCSVDTRAVDPAGYMDQEVTHHMDGSSSMLHLQAWDGAAFSAPVARPDSSAHMYGQNGHGQAPTGQGLTQGAPASTQSGPDPARPRQPVRGPASPDQDPPLSFFFSGFALGGFLVGTLAFLLDLRRRRAASSATMDHDAGSGPAPLLKQDSVAIAARVASAENSASARV